MSFNFTHIDKKCGTTNNYTALVISSASVTSILMLLTIPLNSLIVFVLIKDRKQKRYKSLFYKLLLNIAIADLLTGLVADPNVVNTFAKETLHIKITIIEIYIVQLSIFVTDGVALCTLTLLSIDRIIAIVSPIKHFQGTRQITRNVLVTSTWIFGICLVLPWFKIGYIRQLFLYCIISITVTALSLIVAIVIYRVKLKPIATSAKVGKCKLKDNNKIKTESLEERSSLQESGISDLAFTEICDATKNDSITKTNSVNPDVPSESAQKSEIETHHRESSNFSRNSKITETKTTHRVGGRFLSNKQARIQQRATRAFLIMLCVFMATYLPTAVTIIFMNICTTCNCLAVHIMRDASSIAILSSSVFRPLNFILTLKHLKKAILLIFGIKEKSKVVSDSVTKNAPSK